MLEALLKLKIVIAKLLNRFAKRVEHSTLPMRFSVDADAQENTLLRIGQ